MTDMVRLVAAAVEGRPLADIASEAGASVSTVQRRLKEPEVRQQIDEGRRRLREEAVGRLSTMRTAALNRLADLLDSDIPQVALRAVDVVLRTSTSYERAGEFEDRLARLEEMSQSASSAEEAGAADA